MSDRPILFSAPMVRAILAGRKTQTRRVVKLKDHKLPLAMGYWRDGADGAGKCVDPNGPVWSFGRRVPGDPHERVGCPYGQPGDRLWVRENWQAWDRTSHEYDEAEPWDKDRRGGLTFAQYYAEHGRPYKITYEADPEYSGPWNPSIHMPRWASRITLEITGVRVERLQEISEKDAISEGATAMDIPKPWGSEKGWSMDWSRIGQRDPFSASGTLSASDICLSSPRHAFWNLIDKINGDGTWDANPWVWAVQFKRVTP